MRRKPESDGEGDVAIFSRDIGVSVHVKNQERTLTR